MQPYRDVAAISLLLVLATVCHVKLATHMSSLLPEWAAFQLPPELESALADKARMVFGTIDFTIAFFRPIWPAIPSSINRWQLVAKLIAFLHHRCHADFLRTLSHCHNPILVCLGEDPVAPPLSTIDGSVELSGHSQEEEREQRPARAPSPSSSSASPISTRSAQVDDQVSLLRRECAQLKASIADLQRASDPAVHLARPFPKDFLQDPAAIPKATSHPHLFRQFVDILFVDLASTWEAVYMFRHFVEPHLLDWFSSDAPKDDPDSPAAVLRRLVVARRLANEAWFRGGATPFDRFRLSEKIVELLPREYDAPLRSFDVKDLTQAAVESVIATRRKRPRPENEEEKSKVTPASPHDRAPTSAVADVGADSATSFRQGSSRGNARGGRTPRRGGRW